MATVDGQSIREWTIDKRGGMHAGGIGFRSKTTALASATDRLVDTVHLKGSSIGPNLFTGDFIRITSTSNSDAGYVGRVKNIDPTTGELFLDPPAGAAIVSGATYEIFRFGIHPDSYDKARDRALVNKVSTWLYRPLSVLPDVSEWSTSAYSVAAGGVSAATAAVTATAFPNEVVPSSMLVSNTAAANGLISSPVYYCQPGEQFLVFGRVSSRVAAAKVRVSAPLVPAASSEVTLTEETTFTGRGWRYFRNRFVVPAGADAVQLWLSGTAATSVNEWLGVGMVPIDETEFSLPARVRSLTGVGLFQEFRFPTTPSRSNHRYERDDIDRHRGGAGVRVYLPGGAHWPTYYEERHRYTALQSTYFTAADREIGDAATTTADKDYIEAATVVELLENVARNDELQQIYDVAVKDLAVAEALYGPEEKIVTESRNPGVRPRHRRV